jgi:hypothetical protein
VKRKSSKLSILKSKMSDNDSGSSDESENGSQPVERVQTQVEEGGSVCRIVIPGKTQYYSYLTIILYLFNWKYFLLFLRAFDIRALVYLTGSVISDDFVNHTKE